MEELSHSANAVHHCAQRRDPLLASKRFQGETDVIGLSDNDGKKISTKEYLSYDL